MNCGVASSDWEGIFSTEKTSAGELAGTSRLMLVAIAQRVLLTERSRVCKSGNESKRRLREAFSGKI